MLKERKKRGVMSKAFSFIGKYLFLIIVISFVVAGYYYDQPKNILRIGVKYLGLLILAGSSLGIIIYFLSLI
jgi:uncharacterized membrane protein